MAAPAKTPASSNRWGSFLSQAVAGVESRLDNMLGDADDGTASAASSQGHSRKPSSSTPTPTSTPTPPARTNSVNSRANSTTRANDRLQARLAKAMAAKGQSGAASPRSSIDQARRPSMERPSMERPSMERDSSDASAPQTPQTPNAPTIDSTEAVSQTKLPDQNGSLDAHADQSTETSTPANTADEKDYAPAKPQAEETGEAPKPKSEQTPTPTITTTRPDSDQITQPAAAIQPSALEVTSGDASKLKQEVEKLKQQQQEEVQEYIERIDTLQAKIQYLSKNAAESAKKTASSAPSGSMERKLAEKDERIALLMEEGRKLSTTEQKFRTALKKLRLQLADTEKQVDELKKGKDKALSDSEALRSKLESSESNEKVQEEARRAAAGLQKEIESLKKEKAAKDETLRRLRQEMETQAEQAETANSNALKKALDAERSKQKELEDTLAGLRASKEAQGEKHRLELIDLREKLDRAVERGRNIETELKVELTQAESKLEAMRVAAEEATSGSAGDAQLKLVRQIETLQTQYATASDNWQGIEASLLAKVAGLEKEKDEAQRRESEMRKKAREASSRCRRLEEELQDLQPELANVRQELEACKQELKASQAAAKSAQTGLEEARAELEKQRRSSRREESADAERRQWVEDVVGATKSQNQSRPASPFFPIARTFSTEFNGLPLPGGRPRRAPTPGSIPDAAAEVMSVGMGRRVSAQPPMRSGTGSTGFNPPPSPFLPFEAQSEGPAPSPSILEREQGGEEAYLASPRQMAQDMISVSTVAAGPSVQLVERMSAAIRRLEAEKVAAKEEMARVYNQRDEARADMVSLMKDLEAAKAAPSRVKELEQEVADLNQRYQTTLEMLGEKSELVEELKADVQDVKAMYRELVERTVK
ncbi:TATA element modulatory factor 1 TATA binding-domain-containing protein [Stachybotrys elegans]|uniref:TATA element modulatory factor 1 TATA binding-domain-containing protein n=1 Tax=Stachybotrys elegans TaxID=80388 RepID=A0A8K0WVZ0_9HYPO|nr:TATA element modulatory factor 1 TATA binding-domain-containing protein [Stachybotrys elegans]